MKAFKNPLISIIVPVYNVESYLEECIVSIQKQDYDNVEIIFVDDGSTDSSPSILKKYALIDERINVISKENGGLSSARNAGLNIAKGDYIAFVDSDDYISPQMLSFLYEKLIKHGVDIAACSITQFLDSSPTNMKLWKNLIKDSLLSSYEYLNLILLKKIDNASWNKLYSSSLLKDIRFDESKINEDILFLLKIFGKKPSFYYSCTPYYFYRIRNNSLTQKVTSQSFHFVSNALDIYSIVLDKYPNLLKCAEVYLCYESVSYLSRLLKNRKLAMKYSTEFKYSLQVLKKHIFSLLLNKNASNRLKLKVILIYYFPFVFRIKHSLMLTCL